MSTIHSPSVFLGTTLGDRCLTTTVLRGGGVWTTTVRRGAQWRTRRTGGGERRRDGRYTRTCLTGARWALTWIGRERSGAATAVLTVPARHQAPQSQGPNPHSTRVRGRDVHVIPPSLNRGLDAGGSIPFSFGAIFLKKLAERENTGAMCSV